MEVRVSEFYRPADVNALPGSGDVMWRVARHGRMAPLSVSTRCLQCPSPSLAGVEPLRLAAGAGTNTRDNPASLETFQPVEDAGGWLDRKQRPRAITAGK